MEIDLKSKTKELFITGTGEELVDMANFLLIASRDGKANALLVKDEGPTAAIRIRRNDSDYEGTS